MIGQGHTGEFPFAQYPHKAQTAVTLSDQQRSLGFPLVRPAANSSRVYVLSFSSLLNHPLMFGCASSHGQVCASISASKHFLNKTNGAFSNTIGKPVKDKPILLNAPFLFPGSFL